MKPLVSIIIPTFNYSEFIAETLESVYNQTFLDWECIIIDDGSTDNTQEVVQSFLKRDTRFKYYNKKNEGRSIARNYGIENSKGSYIQFLDSDDLLLPQKIETQMKIFIENPEIDVCYCDFSFFDSTNGLIIKTAHFTKQITNPLQAFLFEFGISGFIIPIHSALFKRSILIGKEVFSSKIEGREDWLFWIDLAKHNRVFSFVNEKLVLYRKHNKSTSHNEKLVNYFSFKTVFLVFDKLPSEYKTEFIETYSNYFTKIIENKNQRLENILTSRSFKLIKIITRIKNKIFK